MEDTSTPATALTPASVQLYADGPLLLRGDVQILDSDGRVIDPGRRTVALCRCGRSGLKPFCDGSHRPARFRATGRDERPRPDADTGSEPGAAASGPSA